MDNMAHTRPPVCPIDDSPNCKLLKEIHAALIGDPLNPNSPPGLVTMVERHNFTLYGKSGKNGLAGDNRRFNKILWMGGGAVIVAQIIFAWILAMISAGVGHK
jgi:hypothetical protein